MRSLLLEIKRQAGDVNSPAPGETDLLAFLNRAIESIWNYGARMNSPVLYKKETFSSVDGTILVPSGIMRLKDVFESTSGNRIPAITLQRALEIGSRLTALSRRYVEYPAKIEVYPLTEPISADIVYIPYYSRIEDNDRGEEIAFSPELDNSIIAMTLGLIAGTPPDANMAQARFGNAVSRYFRPRGANTLVGRGPW